MLSFGVTFMLDPPPSRVVEWAKLAEDNGFDYVWAWDSHVLWQDVYPVFTLIATNTERIRIGPCVTNPATRDITVTASALATLNEISGGRMVMGIGRGDSARRVIGKPPVTVERLEEACRTIKDLAEGREVDYEGTPTQLKWAKGPLPVWVAAYGPKALRCAGRVADGLIMQLADPYIVEWSLQYVKEGAKEAGRRFEDIQIMSAAPAYVTDDLQHARDQVRWFPALVSNHVVDLVKRYATTDLPQALTDFIKARDHYDYAEHGRTGAEHASFVTDEVVDRFCVIGTAEQCLAKLKDLEALGVDQFNIYSMVDDPAAVIESFGKQLIPAFDGGGRS
ncbi:MAG TPA: TIGR03842 family LLM class F420-dependent oxidoreductase [Actinomycetota bacterium]|jgi:probable F420-dependent oxidoreductase|nr:TIGR03842 family LLM class F420-dependent oxidoreductase [Actinomycetota bacterium]